MCLQSGPIDPCNEITHLQAVCVVRRFSNKSCLDLGNSQPLGITWPCQPYQRPCYIDETQATQLCQTLSSSADGIPIYQQWHRHASTKDDRIEAGICKLYIYIYLKEKHDMSGVHDFKL